MIYSLLLLYFISLIIIHIFNNSNNLICNISVVIPSTFPTFNYCKTRINNMIEHQYIKPYEVIIVISKFNKTSMIKYKRYGTIFIIYFKKGIHNQAENRNTGIKLAQCKYISFFDSDDYMSKSRIKFIIYTFKQNHKIDIILHSFTYTKKSLYNDNPNKITLSDYTYNYSFEDIYNSYYKNKNCEMHKKYCCRFLNRNRIHNAWLSGKTKILKLNLYNESKMYYRIEDTELNSRLIMKKYNLILVKYNLGIYIPHSNCRNDIK